jgi:hypothetical protein
MFLRSLGIVFREEWEWAESSLASNFITAREGHNESFRGIPFSSVMLRAGPKVPNVASFTANIQIGKVLENWQAL